MPPRLMTAAVLLLAPAAAQAALTVHIEHKQVAPTPETQWVHLDVYLEDTAGQDENLRSFRLYVDGPQNQSGGVVFDPPKTFGIPPSSPAHPYLFPSPVGEPGKYYPNNLPTTFDRLGAIASWGEDGVDVSPSRNGLIQLPVKIPANAPAGVYTFLLDADETLLSSTVMNFSGAGAQPVPFAAGQAGRITITPEPASLSLLCLPALLMMRRRRA